MSEEIPIPKFEDDLNTSKVVVIGLTFCIFVFAIIAAVQTIFYNMQENERIKKTVAQPDAEYSTLLSDQQEQLNSYHWLNQKEGVLAIPIDRAMEIIVTEKDTGHEDNEQ